MKPNLGDEVRLIRDIKNEEHTYSKGTLGIVEYYVPEGDPDAEGGPAFYELRREYGMGNFWANEADVERTRTAEELNARRLPTRAEIIQALPLSWGYREGLDIFESDASPATNEIEFYGQTEAGLRFGVRLEVVDIWETDM